jgi:hypothetical protein
VVGLRPRAAALLESALGRLLQGERAALLAEDQELSANDACGGIGISRPLVVHRVDVAELTLRYVGKHRGTKPKYPSGKATGPIILVLKPLACVRRFVRKLRS